ncbi:hypothetical protein A8975_0995 [Meridianimaribacter flavus]|jgi:hypothetical protein|uniref:Uncharacterized protein n=1 Tax=Meridianimaribacter flavus TaxID=571115 RepID=A0ABY2G687_9FLAO|nr:hypothetical protein A8975_0995 [Meridianimaribacter flavus]
MNDILKIIFSIFDFYSEYSLNKDSHSKLTKKQKKIAYLVATLCIVIPIIIIFIIEIN